MATHIAVSLPKPWPDFLKQVDVRGFALPRSREASKLRSRELKLDFETFVRRWEREMAPSISNRDRHEVTMQLWKQYF